MTHVPTCPKILPHELVALIEQFGKSWAASPLRPKPSKEVLQAWSELIEKWIQDKELPLLVRKQSNNRGSVINHITGRELVPTDNSAAHWAYTLAIKNQCPSIEQLKEMLAKDTIPIAMIQKAVEKPIAKYHCSLRNEHNINTYNWKLAHIKGVGLKTRAALDIMPIEKIITQFRNLMLPSNMFAIPLAWSGLGEIESVIQAVANHME